MPRVAVLGANGQVGAELCLLLAGVPGIDLVPISRNRSGSAFLRWHGIRCRHGRVAVAAEAQGLLADCDVVVNSALASGTPAQMRQIEDAIVHNAFAFSRPSALIIHFSTQSVYGDPTAGKLIRWRSLYGRAKLATEARVRGEARRFRKAAFILRLGHVCGALQQISSDIRREISEDRVVLPEHDRPSNTVYTATIVEAVLAAIQGRVPLGRRYDLMNVPQWTWRAVYEYEARATGHELRPTLVPAPTALPSLPIRVMRGVARLAADAAAGPFARQLVATGLSRLPPKLSERGQAWWYRKRARNEIASLSPFRAPADHLLWEANGSHFIDALSPTAELLERSPRIDLTRPRTAMWSEDLRLSEGVQAPAVAARERTS
jgi:nucleoside-diphosphate-sugar epimerase